MPEQSLGMHACAHECVLSLGTCACVCLQEIHCGNKQDSSWLWFHKDLEVVCCGHMRTQKWFMRLESCLSSSCSDSEVKCYSEVNHLEVNDDLEA